MLNLKKWGWWWISNKSGWLLELLTEPKKSVHLSCRSKTKKRCSPMRMRNPLFLCEDPACEAEFTILDADLALSDNLLSPTTYLLNTKNTIFLFYISLWCFFVFRDHICVWQASILKLLGGGSCLF